jgi:hypothetical protein
MPKSLFAALMGSDSTVAVDTVAAGTVVAGTVVAAKSLGTKRFEKTNLNHSVNSADSNTGSGCSHSCLENCTFLENLTYFEFS